MFISRYFAARYWLARFFRGAAADLAKACVSDAAGTITLSCSVGSITLATAAGRIAFSDEGACP